ncbi:phage tail assembly protein [uncultured Pseudomonas sp.]|uniref:phage tail assembly protein n=1 Tax=uncultured Pseudomonas sp. TaxID=114707 RepID=UPI0020532D05|nr:phage tail assembly protein [uncultured Pseudomonas sp.]DAN37762.1 MAG TPA: tail assembly chaperone protein [Caudoviricetes sp.]
MSEVVKLSAPIEAHGAQLSELTIRRPTPQEARAIRGLPYKIDTDEAVVIDLEVAAKYIVVCAGIPSSSVNQLDLADLNSLSWKLAGFFMTPASST